MSNPVNEMEARLQALAVEVVRELGYGCHPSVEQQQGQNTFCITFQHDDDLWDAPPLCGEFKKCDTDEAIKDEIRNHLVTHHVMRGEFRRRYVEKRPTRTPAVVAAFITLLAALVAGYWQLQYKLLPDDPSGPSLPTPTPAATPTPSREARIEEELRKLAAGKIVFNPPANMRQGKSEKVEARVTSQDIGKALTEGLKGRGAPQAEVIKVGDVMKVYLYGEEGEFRIMKLSSDEQVVRGRPYSQWEWMVTPLKSGLRTLHLKATVSLSIEGVGEKAVDAPVIDRPVDVEVNVSYVIVETAKKVETWQYILGGGSLAGLLTGGWAFLKVRKRRRPAGFTS